MLIIPPPKSRNRRIPVKPAIGPAALVMTSATYSYSPAFVEIVFDRAVNVSLFNPAAIAVSDFDYNNLSYLGSGSAVLVDSVTVKVELTSVGPATGIGIKLNASNESGIVAVDDGGTWAGVSDYVLPDP